MSKKKIKKNNIATNTTKTKTWVRWLALFLCLLMLLGVFAGLFEMHLH